MTNAPLALVNHPAPLSGAPTVSAAVENESDRHRKARSALKEGEDMTTVRTISRPTRFETNELPTPNHNPLELEAVRFSDAYPYGFHVELMRSPYDLDDGVYLSTFQVGRGQHITSLTQQQARELALALMRAADAGECPE